MIYVVTGLARSGSSMMMRMLEASGIPAVYDDKLKPSVHNPHGFYQLSTVGSDIVREDWYREADGKCVKVQHPHIMNLRHDIVPIKAIVMKREHHEAVASMKKLSADLGHNDKRNDGRMVADRLVAWREVIYAMSYFKHIVFDYNEFMRDDGYIKTLNEFVGREVVNLKDLRLYRNQYGNRY